jgi:biopolymer transport protein ExbB/TolQ
LIQAIPALVFYTIFKNMLSRRMFEVGSAVEALMRPFKAFGAKPKA